jgi:type IV secretory pathway TrbL component
VNAELLNTLIGTFVAALDGAFGALYHYSIPLLAILGTMYLLLCVGQLILQTPSLGALGDFLWVALKIGVIYFIAFAFYDLFWNGGFYTFLQWGLEAGGGGFGLDAFMNPSAVVDTGFKAAAPMYDVLNNMTMAGKAYAPWTFATYIIAYWVTVLAFGVMAVHVIMTLLDIKLAIASGAVLFPWCVLTQTSVLGELSLSWITAGLVRVLLTSLLMSIGVPLFQMVNLGVSPRTGGADPTFYGGAVVAIVAFVYMALVWVLPNRAAAMGGRGMALALGSDVLIGAGMAGWSAVNATAQAGAAAIRGTSAMVQALRRAA